jgi:hypothetical protein
MMIEPKVLLAEVVVVVKLHVRVTKFLSVPLTRDRNPTVSTPGNPYAPVIDHVVRSRVVVDEQHAAPTSIARSSTYADDVIVIVLPRPAGG